MHRMHISWWGMISVIAVTAIGSLPVAAAEIRADPSTNFGAVLEGKIEPGDFEKVRSFLFSEYSLEIFLASPGGDLAEAMKIGRLVRSLKLETVVPGKFPSEWLEKNPGFRKAHNLKDFSSDYTCASACFFVFVAGIRRFRDSPFGAILGIHRPYLSEANLQAATSDEAIASTNRTRAAVESYLKEMGVPAKYADEMFSISNNDIRWISDDEVYADFNGFVPELRDWVDARCDKRSDSEKNLERRAEQGKIAKWTPTERAMLDTLFEKHKQQVDCEIDLQHELALQAYEQALKLKNQTPPR